MNGNKVYITKQTVNGSSSTEFSVEREHDRTRKRQRPPTATLNDSTFRIRRTFRTETARVHFVREISSRNRASVIRTDETTISDDGKDVMTLKLLRTYMFPCGIYRGEYLEGNISLYVAFLFTTMRTLSDESAIREYIYIYIYIDIERERERVRGRALHAHVHTGNTNT